MKVKWWLAGTVVVITTGSCWSHYCIADKSEYETAPTILEIAQDLTKMRGRYQR